MNLVRIMGVVEDELRVSRRSMDGDEEISLRSVRLPDEEAVEDTSADVGFK